MIPSHSFQGLSPSLCVSGGFAVITHLLRPDLGTFVGDSGRLAQGKWKTGGADDLLNSVASYSSTRLLIRGCSLGHAGHSAALWWVSVCASSPLLSIQCFSVAVWAVLFNRSFTAAIPLHANWVHRGASAGQPEVKGRAERWERRVAEASGKWRKKFQR